MLFAKQGHGQYLPNLDRLGLEYFIEHRIVVWLRHGGIEDADLVAGFLRGYDFLGQGVSRVDEDV